MSKFVSFVAVLLLIDLLQTFGFVGEDGHCKIFTFLPFTSNGTTLSPIVKNSTVTGFTHMAAALMAMDHFNSRDNSVIPELSSHLSGCDIRFDINTSVFFDSGLNQHEASRAFFEKGQIPCAIAGPFHDAPALELSTMALAAEIPIMLYRSENVRLSVDFYNPFTQVIYPDLLTSAKMLVDYLVYRRRTDYIGFIYAISDTGTHRHEALTFRMDERGISYAANPYMTPALGPPRKGRDIYTALSKIPGYRTIIVAMEFPLLELPLIADAAESLGLLNGQVFWSFFGAKDPALLLSENKNVQKLMKGSVWIVPLEKYIYDPESDPFLFSWRSQGPDEVARLNEMNPRTFGSPGFVLAGHDFFNTTLPDWGSAHLYDAIMSIGLGACLAQTTSNISTISGVLHRDSIRKLVFTGATGLISFGIPNGGGARNTPEVWGAFNFLNHGYQMSDIFQGDQWQELIPYVYADGTLNPQLLLRDTPNQNYLSKGFRIMGLSLMSLVILLVVLSTIWIYLHRATAILLASQPYALYLICFGCAVQASTIFTLSNDESYGWSTEQLSRSCVATPWLLSLGHIIIYGSLFIKIWRVNKVLQFARRKVEPKHVAWPLGILFLAAIIVLSFWTGSDNSLEWERVEINSQTGESIGQCESSNMSAFLVPLVGLVMIPTVMTMVMTWKTRDVSETFSESSYIFLLILVQLEVAVVAAPVIFILRDISTDGRYVGMAFMLSIFPLTTLIFIIFPKILAVHKKRGDQQRGASHGVRVSGLISSNLRSELRDSSGVLSEEMHPDTTR